MRHRTIGQLVTRKEVVNLPRTATVREAGQIMAEQRIGAVLVLDHGVLAGIFTERDALFRVVAVGLDPATTTLDQVMTRDLVTLGPEASTIDALRLMTEVGFRHLPILDGERVHGIISLRDFVGAEFQQVGAG